MAWDAEGCVVLIDTDHHPIGVCYWCGSPLDPRYDYSCVSCTRETCDNDSQMCQADGCDTITCFRCVELHLDVYHLGAVDEMTPRMVS